METCYRHPGRETGLSCSNCGRPICTDCITQTPVGLRCPECAGRARVRMPGFMMGNEPRMTYLLIAVNVALFLATNKIGSGGGGGGLFGSGGQLNSLGRDMALSGHFIAQGEYYRLITSAFIHYGLLHLAFNMFGLYLLGGALERYAGTWRFAAIYVLSALGGSFGALLLSPNALTAGASGAIFGLMGALLVLERQRGVALLGGSIGGLLLVNLIFTFAYAGSISVGGHLGGLAGGILTGLLLSGFGRGHLAYSRATPLTVAGLLLLAGVLVGGSVAVAGS
jgi:membrane associated rhomboid family serine protease